MVNDSATPAFSVNPGIEQTKPIENRFDYSICGGLGIEIRTKKAGYFIVEGRYDYGLGNIYKNNKGEDFSLSNNQAITVSIAYLFNVNSLRKEARTNR